MGNLHRRKSFEEIEKMKKKFRTFEEARKFVQTLGLKSSTEWSNYCKSGKKPTDFPAKPNVVYKNKGWTNWGDWLGSGRIADQLKQYRPFEDARKFIRSLSLPSRQEFEDYCKSGKKPEDIPAGPRQTYKNQFNGWGDWLGTGTVANFNRKYKSFNEAREFVRSLGVKTEPEWQRWCKTHKRPLDIPYSPERTYKDQWTTMGDWFGTGRIADKNKVWRNFSEARKFVHSLGLKRMDDWRIYSKSKEKPFDIPADPPAVYKKYWKDMGDWLGTGRIGNRSKNWLPFSEAKKEYQKLAKQYGIRNRKDWVKFTASGKKPENIPANPWIVYTREKIMSNKKK